MGKFVLCCKDIVQVLLYKISVVAGKSPKTGEFCRLGDQDRAAAQKHAGFPDPDMVQIIQGRHREHTFE